MSLTGASQKVGQLIAHARHHVLYLAPDSAVLAIAFATRPSHLSKLPRLLLLNAIAVKPGARRAALLKLKNVTQPFLPAQSDLPSVINISGNELVESVEREQTTRFQQAGKARSGLWVKRGPIRTGFEECPEQAEGSIRETGVEAHEYRSELWCDPRAGVQGAPELIDQHWIRWKHHRRSCANQVGPPSPCAQEGGDLARRSRG